MPIGSTNLGFRFVQVRSEKLNCDVFPIYVPSLDNNYDPMSTLGTVITSGQTVISNRFVRCIVNLQGAFSSIRYDPNGASNYGGEDFIEPGTPWEGYSFHAESRGVIGGGNARSPSSISTTLRNIGTNYLATITGNISIGHLITQIRIFNDEPIIQMQMSYTNTSSIPLSVKAMRALDPDQGVGQGFGYSTQNFRGADPVSKNDIVFAFAGNEGIAVFVPGNGYVHNTGIVSSWPTFDPNLYLNETSNSTGDVAIGGAWNFGIINPGSTVTVCCYYIFGTTVNNILSYILL